MEGIQGVIDVHSHILPGIDDGARDWEQSCEMLDIAWKQGIRTIIATPHFMPRGKNPEVSVIKEAAEKLQEYAKRKGYDMQILTGNEIYYHDEVPELLEKGRILTMADSSYVLVEFSPMDDYRYIRNSLATLQAEGYSPIIAHVERYANLCKKPFDRIQELRDMGVLIQVNASTIERKMGWKMQLLVMSMIKKKLVDLIGTDAHSSGSRSPQIEKCCSILEKKCSEKYLNKLLYRNAEKYILQDTPLI